MKNGLVAAAILILLCFAGVSQAGIVFSLEQTTPGDIPQGTSMVFNVLVHSTVENQSFLAADFSVSLSSSSGAGGRFTSGTNPLLVNGGYFPGTFPATSANFSSVATNALTLGSTDQILATITLGTSNAQVVPGTYTMSLSGLDATDGGFNQLVTNAAGPLSYTISNPVAPVPEPTSIALLGIAAASAGWRIVRRRQKATA